jgi:hypothetical protein
MNKLFNLPSDILRLIYEYDSTYKDLLTNILKTELNEKVFDNYYKREFNYSDGDYLVYLIRNTMRSIKRNPDNKVYVSDLSNIISCSNNQYIMMIKNVRFDFYILYEEDIKKGYGNKEDAIKYKERYLFSY